jgi:hypothetical protein
VARLDATDSFGKNLVAMKCVSKIALAIALASAAQNMALAQLSLGVEGGPAATNLAEQNRSAPSPFHYLYGFVMPFGLFAEYQFHPDWAINAGISYIPVGAVSTDKHPLLQQAAAELLYTDCMSELRLHYLSFPIHVQYSLPLGSELSLFGQAGPGFQLLLYAQQNDKGYGTIYGSDQSTVLSQQFLDMRKGVTSGYRSWNLSADANIGLKWQVGSEYGIIKLGRSYGLTRIERRVENGSHSIDAYFLMIGYAVSIQP